jgi:hypothetical protein
MMQRMYIQVRNGGPFEHPILEDNMRWIFPDFDPDNPPEGYEEFVRVPMPEPKPFEIHTMTAYEKRSDGMWTDVHYVRPMVDHERTAVLTHAETYRPFPSWILNEDTLAWEAPKKPPAGRKYRYNWNEGTQEWVRGDKI